jgi:hypothetical protein
MDVAASDPSGTLTFATASNRAHLSRLAKAGRALRLAPGAYAVGAALPPEEVARNHRFGIICRYWPTAVLCGRTALAGGMPVDGWMFVAHPDPQRRAPLRLPGLRVGVEIGPPALPGDMPMPEGLAISGTARRLVENVDVRGRRPRSRAGTVGVEEEIDGLARSGGTPQIQRTLRELDVIAGSFDQQKVRMVRERLVVLLGTGTGRARSPVLAARLSGDPYDARRLERMGEVLARLAARAPQPRVEGGDTQRWGWEPFFEAYFSNFIEGTEFGVEEARRIAIEGVVPTGRPADAHDVAATYRLVNDPDERVRVPMDAMDLLDLLRSRHEVLMAARPDKRPGMFKTQPNFAGGYQFVEPDLVEGTLRWGFDMMGGVDDPFGRAVGMMALLTEVHPFDDGNGRLARVMANAELSQGGQIRMMIPTSFRNNYIAALSAVSTGHGEGQSLIAVLDFAQRWVGAIDWRTFDGAHAQIEGSNGYVDPALAESTGRRLRMPDAPPSG